jgi:hypothetical protein
MNRPERFCSLSPNVSGRAVASTVSVMSSLTTVTSPVPVPALAFEVASQVLGCWVEHE